MNISIGSRPISKVLVGFGSAVILDGIAIIIDAASKDWSMTREAWIALVIGTFGPPTAAYFKKLSGKDVVQIVESNPTAVKAELDLVTKTKAPY